MAMNLVDVAAPPPGTRYVAEWYVSRGFEEETALRYLAYGHPVLLWGPRKQGCTWLCQHVARTWQRAAAERLFMVVDFRTLGRSALASLDTCLYEVARTLDEALPHARASEDAPRVPLADRWVQARGDAKVRLTEFLYGTVLPAVRGELLLVLDHADLVHGQPFYDDVVGLLRSWADKGATGAPWARLRLLVSVSVPPARLTTARYQSPFVNLSEPIQVGDFNRAQVAELVRRHDLAWTEADLARLMSIVGGQPYLICAVLDDVSHGCYSLDDLAAGKSLGRSRIDDHLSRLRAYLDAMPALGAAFTSLAQNPATSVAPETLDDLIRLGVVTQDAGGRHPVRYRLYERLPGKVATGSRDPEEAWADLARALPHDVMMLDDHGDPGIDLLARHERLGSEDGFQATLLASDAWPQTVSNQDAFGVYVRDALRALHDPFALINNPLIYSKAVRAQVSPAAQPRERAAALQALLIQEAASVRGSARGDNWYRTLDAAYLQPLGKHEAAAAAVGMSYSTFRRNLTAATRHLITALWKRELSSQS